MRAELRTAAQARQAGQKRYFTGKPCKHGHVADRFTHRSVCVACHAACAAARYQRNADSEKQRIAEWGRKNPEKVRGYKRAYKARRKAEA